MRFFQSKRVQGFGADFRRDPGVREGGERIALLHAQRGGRARGGETDAVRRVLRNQREQRLQRGGGHGAITRRERAMQADDLVTQRRPRPIGEHFERFDAQEFGRSFVRGESREGLRVVRAAEPEVGVQRAAQGEGFVLGDFGFGFCGPRDR